ncbi:MAG: flagellin [Lachnospiraceae bacterium]|nr:flagellin [Lachnospiraceae bacterium]
MSMLVQHNLSAMNANRQLGITTKGQAKSSEKLASGYKINKAADDAAGLKISEKMRSQIRGLDKASDNAEDGVSLIQTAEGALNESHSILQRMNELAVQGANDTNQEVDRDAINDELEALTKELDRISQSTQFNKQALLDGTFTDKYLQVGANSNQNIVISIDAMNATSLGLTNISYKSVETGNVPTKVKYQGMSYTYVTKSGDTAISQKTNQARAVSTFKIGMSKATSKAAFAPQYNGDTGSIYYKGVDGEGKPAQFTNASDARKTVVSYNFGVMSNQIMGSTTFKNYVTTSTTVATTSKAVQVGRPSVKDYNTANATLSAVQEAINRVSTQRSALGALQNRLEHTIANLDNVSENTQAAESRIRDTDMASEMVEYSKNNILAQAGQSMLAQANQSTQGVLSLLQ